MRDLLRSLLQSTRTTLILVTHSRDDALDLAERVVVLENGRPVVQDALNRSSAAPGMCRRARTGLDRLLKGNQRGRRRRHPFGKVSTEDR